MKCAFDKKKAEYKKAKLESNHREYETALEWLESTPEHQDYMTARNRLLEMLKPDYEVRNARVDGNYTTPYYYQFDFNKKVSAKNFIGEAPTWRIFENDDELKKFEREQNTLLVKLTYEKDMERIQELLSSYGIEI